MRKKLDYLEPLVMEDDGPPSSEDNYVKTYFCGNFEHLVQTTDILPLPSLSNMTNLSPHEASVISNMNDYLKKQIVFRRNRKMSKTIIKMLNDSSRNESAFFAIGAGKNPFHNNYFIVGLINLQVCSCICVIWSFSLN